METGRSVCEDLVCLDILSCLAPAPSRPRFPKVCLRLSKVFYCFSKVVLRFSNVSVYGFLVLSNDVLNVLEAVCSHKFQGQVAKAHFLVMPVLALLIVKWYLNGYLHVKHLFRCAPVDVLEVAVRCSSVQSVHTEG